MADPEPSGAPHPANRIIRSYSSATLIAAGVAPRIRYVIDGRTGLPVSAVEGGTLEGDEWILHIPEEHGAALLLQVTPRPIDPELHPGADRYRVYHGTPNQRHWVEWVIETGRDASGVFEPEDVVSPNPIALSEPALCKRFNADRECIARLCLGGVKMRPVDPLLVGVDPWGADVRARFGIIRVEFPRAALDADAVAAMIEQFIAEGGA